MQDLQVQGDVQTRAIMQQRPEQVGEGAAEQR